MLINACRVHLDFAVHRYLMANASGRWDAAEKAERHREMSCFYVALHLGVLPEDVDLCSDLYKAVHEATQALTDRLDESIGFPVDGTPDYDTLAPLFFERFHALAMAAMGYSLQAENQVTGTACDLVPCPCGKTPGKLAIQPGISCKHALVSGDCCGEWLIEFRTHYLDLMTPECMALAKKAWNMAPRAWSTAAGPALRNL